MEPLTPATQKLLAPLTGLSPRDHLELDVMSATAFRASIYRRVEEATSYVTRHLSDAIETAMMEGAGHDDILHGAYEAVSAGDVNASREAIATCVREIAHPDVRRHVNLAMSRIRVDPTRSKFNVSRAACSTFPARIPERRKIDDGDWKFAMTDFTACVIDACWPDDQVTMTPEAEIAMRSLLLESKKGDWNAKNWAHYRATKQTPHNEYELHNEHKLSPYQELALCNSMGDDFGLFMKPGTGKTPIVIARVCNEAKKKDGVYFAIVVCPKNVRLNWQHEFKKFSTCTGRVTVLRGGALQRRKQIIDAFTLDGDEEFTAIVCSYDTVVNTWRDLQLIPWDLAVGDESHYFKNPTTTRFKYMMKLRDVSVHRMPLTGTPVTNNPLDLYAHFEFMSKGTSGFIEWKNFKSFHGVFKPTENGDLLIGCQNVPLLQERFSRKSFMITLEEALPDLPDKRYDIVEVEMTPRQTEVYKQVAKTLALEIEGDLASDRPKSMVVQNVLTKLLRLAQITSGFVVWGEQRTDDGDIIAEKEEADIEERNPKMEALLELASEKGPNDKTLVWACFRHDIQLGSRALREAGYDCVEFYGSTKDADREEAERRFNSDPDCRWMVGNPGAGGTGLNLLGYDHRGESDDPRAMETNCNHTIYVSQDWSPVKREQSEGRGRRRGQRVPMRITDICVPQTVDETIRTRVTGKLVNAMELSDVRAILDSILETPNE